MYAMSHRILIVDDDPHIRQVLSFALGKAGMKTEEAGDGESALERDRRAAAGSGRARHQHAADERPRRLP